MKLRWEGSEVEFELELDCGIIEVEIEIGRERRSTGD